MWRRVPVIPPKLEPAAMFVFGLFQFGWFVKLNASNRNCSLCRSVNLKSLCIEKSRPTMPGESSGYKKWQLMPSHDALTQQPPVRERREARLPPYQKIFMRAWIYRGE